MFIRSDVRFLRPYNFIPQFKMLNQYNNNIIIPYLQELQLVVSMILH